ncbi:hypothetical protein [Aeromonas dhakensis]|uniref:hypothetical protein n=1 Tax=Aeromonas dhakensis TaxID=196024 RepID=UPI0039873AF5
MKFAHLKYNHENGLKRNILIIDSKKISVAAKAHKWFTNIPISQAEKVELAESDESCELLLSDQKLYHPDQDTFDKRYNIQKHTLNNTTIYYSLSGNVETPKKILVTFPGVSNFDNVNYRLSALTSLQERLKDTLILALQDKEGVYGNYLYRDSNGSMFKPVVISLISGLMSIFGLAEHDIIFYGNSKGGTIAIDYIESYPGSFFFIDIPQLDLYNYLSQNALMRYSLGEEARKYYNFIKYLPSVNNKRVTYSFAEDDIDASRNLPMSMFSKINVVMLKDMPHSGSAMQLVKRQFSKIIQLISDTSPIERPQINALWEVKDNYIFFNRTLGSFTDESSINKVYAEIEFFNSSENYFISLNNTFDEKMKVGWTKGFNAVKHLSNGSFNMKLHVYSNYREYIYPLEGEIFICNDKIYESYHAFMNSWDSTGIIDQELTS